MSFLSLGTGHVTASIPLAGTKGTPPQVIPQTIRWQSQRLGQFGGRLELVGRPEEQVEVVEVALGGGSWKLIRRSCPLRQLGVGCALAEQLGGACMAGQPLSGWQLSQL
jgi:hypothetical protein